MQTVHQGAYAHLDSPLPIPATSTQVRAAPRLRCTSIPICALSSTYALAWMAQSKARRALKRHQSCSTRHRRATYTDRKIAQQKDPSAATPYLCIQGPPYTNEIVIMPGPRRCRTSTPHSVTTVYLGMSRNAVPSIHVQAQVAQTTSHSHLRERHFPLILS